MRTTTPLIPLLTAALFAGCQSTPTAGTAPAVQVVYLRHVKAGDLARILNQFLGEARESGARESEDREGSAVCTPHDEANALLVSGSEQRVRQLLVLIERLDVPPNG